MGGSDTLLVFLQNHRPVVYPVGSDPTAPPLLLQAEFSDMALDAIHVLATEGSVVFASRDHIFLARIDGYSVAPVVTITGARVTALAADVTSGEYVLLFVLTGVLVIKDKGNEWVVPVAHRLHMLK